MINRVKIIFSKKWKPLLKVYSHPRSGTHFLEAFLAENFYEDKDLFIANVNWGHWSNRLVNSKGNPFGKLFGNHYFADKNNNNEPKIYIVRDGRAVAYSVWKTPNFLHKNISDLNFREFLKTPIDWYGTPSTKTVAKFTIMEHWAQHVESWYKLAKLNNNVLIIKYEDLVTEPYVQYVNIHNKFFKKTQFRRPNEINIIERPVGLLPNKAKIDSWESMFDQDGLEFYNKLLKSYNIEL